MSSLDQQSSTPPGTPRTSKRVYRPPISGLLRVLLVTVLSLFALLGANSAYLLAIRYMEWNSEQVWQNYFYIQMFLLHLVLGVLLIVPLLAFVFGHLGRVYRNRNRRAVRAGYAASSDQRWCGA